MDKDELTTWALANGWQMIAGCPSLTKPRSPKEAIVRMVFKTTVVNQGNRIWNLLDGRRWQLPGSGRIDSTPCGLVTTGGDDGRLHSLL